MNINTEKLLRLSKRMLKRTEEYQENRKSDMSEEDNFQMEYLLGKGNCSKSKDVIAYASNYDGIIYFYPLQQMSNARFVSTWDFEDTSYDSQLFDHLECGYDLRWATSVCHNGIWCEIEESYHEEIEHKAGMQKYLEYCVRNYITKESLKEETGYNGKDIMALYDKEKAKIKWQKGQER